MADFNLRGASQTCIQALDLSGRNVLSSPPHQKTFLKATGHPWTNTILSRGCRRKLFNLLLQVHIKQWHVAMVTNGVWPAAEAFTKPHT